VGNSLLCGIFGFALEKPVEMAHVFKVLHRLEGHQYPNEPKPVGGYGAGIASITSSGKVNLEKVGKAEGSPVERLSRVCRITQASVLVGHVRMPSPNFMETAHFKETAQPYMAQCSSGLSIVSAHNGYVANYEAIRARLGEKHVFESERVGLIDSEVIPHLFEELLDTEKNPNKALDKLFSTIEGSNTISLLQVEDKRLLLHFVHKGKTRGLHIWRNERGEVVFCSRREPVDECFGHMLNQGKFKGYMSIPYGEERSFKTAFAFSLS
jgi:glucosamine 6-phosphate synthetase-like amidotransferase/phosphosugar isomerase protein